ncbi:hypothetical protein QQP08_014494 [Theobroma cacao]|nr:hypothetical protein QQP08_014494 [Theobroma cacao]
MSKNSKDLKFPNDSGSCPKKLVFARFNFKRGDLKPGFRSFIELPDRSRSSNCDSSKISDVMLSVYQGGTEAVLKKQEKAVRAN